MFGVKFSQRTLLIVNLIVMASAQMPISNKSTDTYNGLLVSEEKLEIMRQNRKFEEVFILTKYLRKFDFDGTCGEVKMETNILPSCHSPVYQRVARSSTDCCATDMSISIPYEVTSLSNGQKYTVVHKSTSYQLLHTGHCESEGSVCCSGGTCMQIYRVDWILVQTTTGENFVPVSVPNHCSCIYT